jgi:two-component system cell cycle sensor histidine kinase/response regulator CckA
MDQATVERVFEPFFTTKPAGKGTGLGLATVYGVVKQAGGEIHVDSRVGEGTRFELRLPRAEGAPRPAVSATLPASRYPGGTERILVVDDEDGVRNFMIRVLRRCGYEVLEAESGEAAVMLISRERRPVDVLISDEVMPGIDGVETAARVRAYCPDVGVILVSGRAPEEALGAIEAMADTPLLAKPLAASELALAVRRCLDDRGTNGNGVEVA